MWGKKIPIWCLFVCRKEEEEKLLKGEKRKGLYAMPDSAKKKFQRNILPNPFINAVRAPDETKQKNIYKSINKSIIVALKCQWKHVGIMTFFLGGKFRSGSVVIAKGGRRRGIIGIRYIFRVYPNLSGRFVKSFL